MTDLPRETREAGAEPATTDFDAVIVGAGFSGLYMLHSLRNELGFSARVYEAGTDVGGTWYWNRYPGHEEIRGYLEHVADRFALRRDIRFSTRMVGAAFDEDAKHWTIRTDKGDTVTARFFIAAVGSLSALN